MLIKYLQFTLSEDKHLLWLRGGPCAVHEPRETKEEKLLFHTGDGNEVEQNVYDSMVLITDEKLMMNTHCLKSDNWWGLSKDIS